MQYEIGEGYVARPAKTSSTTIRWRTGRVPSPGLDSRSVRCIVAYCVHRRDILDEVDLAFVLADTTHGIRVAFDKGIVSHVDVGTVLLH